MMGLPNLTSEWRPSEKESSLALAAFIGIPLVAAYTLLAVIKGKLDPPDAQRKIKQKQWPPKGWQIIPILAFFVSLLGYSGHGVWTHGGFEKQAVPLSLYIISIKLIFIRIIFVTTYYKVDLAMAQILCQLAFLSATTWSFYKVKPLSAYLLLPVCFYTVFHSFRTYKAILDNPEASKRFFGKPGNAVSKSQ